MNLSKALRNPTRTSPTTMEQNIKPRDITEDIIEGIDTGDSFFTNEIY